MLDCILALAQRLSLTVVAEGIEQRDQLELLGELGCTMGQGFLLARPTSGPALKSLLTSGRALPIEGRRRDPVAVREA
jgi:EAL domain-containing protein (putative c-di-GMP-specific phosphodiesterase class I)